jgi:hypothetical protein
MEERSSRCKDLKKLTAINNPQIPMQIISTIRQIASEFGVLGWVELSAALLVAIGCGGEFWILLNKLTRHIEPLPKNAGLVWRMLAWVDLKIRPIAVRLKINGRKLSEAKEQLLERSFVMLVAFGVSVEFICLMFSLHEVAALNAKSAKAEQVAALANERSLKLERENLIVRSNLFELAAKINPTRITPEARKRIIASLKEFPNKIKIDVIDI